MVPISQKGKATKAIHAAWPDLVVTKYPQMIRFSDSGDLDSNGSPKPVIDIMLPLSPFQLTILAEHVLVDKSTGDRIPTIEAAVVSKYAATISPNRQFDKREQDAVDLRRLIKTNHATINQTILQELAAQVWEGCRNDILEFFRRALNDQPFEV